MKHIKTWLALAYTFGAMLILVPAGLFLLLLWLIGFRDFARVGFYKVGQAWARSVIKVTGCRLTVSGVENIPKTGGLCIVGNHSGIFDIALLLAYVGRPLGFIAKKEFLYVPVLNMWIALLGGSFIDRKNPRKALKTINKGTKMLERGGVMIVFPEGTRSKGRGILPFRPGSLKLATQAKCPIVPVAISGSYDVFEKTGFVQPVDVKLIFGSVIDPAALPPENRRQYLADMIRGVIVKALDN
jgi:1-acyl-sn-glycerol-3-phosphate acyltransferase